MKLLTFSISGQIPTSLLTTDITRDTPDSNQVRFIPDESTGPTGMDAEYSSTSARQAIVNASDGSFSVGLTNPISDDNRTKSPRSQSPSPSRSPTSDHTINQQQNERLIEKSIF